MPIFKTPHPISLTINVLYAEVTATAGDGQRDTDSTTVQITPKDPNNSRDVDEAAKITVEQPTSTQIVITAPPATMMSIFNRGTAVVRVVCPLGSSVEAKNRKGAIAIRGDVTDVALNSGNGNLDISSADSINARTSNGSIKVGLCRGPLDINSSSGTLEVQDARSTARLHTNNGAVEIGRAGSDVDVKTNNGTVRLRYVVRGSIEARSNNGALFCSVDKDTKVASVDASTHSGKVHNSMDESGGPNEVKIRLHTNSGSITVDRAPAAPQASTTVAPTASGSGSGSGAPAALTEEQDWGAIPEPTVESLQQEALPPRYNQDWRMGETNPPGSTPGDGK